MGVCNIAFGAMLTFAGVRRWQCWAMSCFALLLSAVVSVQFGRFWESVVKTSTTPGVTLNSESSTPLLRATDGSIRNSSWKSMCKFACNARITVFLLITVINGVGNATYDIYILLRLQELQATNFLIGSTAGIGSLANFLFFSLAPRMLKQLGSRWMVIISMATFCVRAWIYSLIGSENVYIVLLAQSLHGLNFSIMVVGAMDYLSEMTGNNELTVFARALFGFAFNGIGG